MITGSKVLNLTIDEGGVPPHIKPLIASIVSAIGQGIWGEVIHSTCTAQQLEEAQDDLAGALEESEASLQEVKEAGQELVEKVENFCNSAEVVAVSRTLKKACTAGRFSTELLEQIEQAGRDFDIAVKKLSAYANEELKYFED